MTSIITVNKRQWTGGRRRETMGTRAEIEVTSWLVSADDFSSRVARGANE